MYLTRKHFQPMLYLKQYSLLIADLAFVIESLIPGLFFFAQAAGLLLSSLDEESKQRNQAKIITYPRARKPTPGYFGWPVLNG